MLLLSFYLRNPNIKINKLCKSFCNVEFINRLKSHGNKLAIESPSHPSLTYNELINLSTNVSDKLKKLGLEIKNRPIAIFCSNDGYYCISKLAIWMSDAISVPLYTQHPLNEIKYILQNSTAQLILCPPNLKNKISSLSNELNIKLFTLPTIEENTFRNNNSNENNNSIENENNNSIKINNNNNAMIIYTSGTTGKPKGVVLTHNNIQNMINELNHIWKWNKTDRILHFLPLHHLHGVLNKLLCCLYAGATCEFTSDQSSLSIWKRLANYNQSNRITIFMAVPTIYIKLIELYKSDKLTEIEKQKAINHMREMRVMISGSSALSNSVFNEWKLITNHVLLERYGMTEFGMALSNRLDGERLSGYVGVPLPGIQVKIVPTETNDNQSNDMIGELRVKGKSVFSRYWDNQKATEEAFDENGWFKTGDIAFFDPIKNSYKILGRESVDIIKSGGYKISSLEIERAILEHSYFIEVCVIGIFDEIFGEKICAIVRLNENQSNHFYDINEFRNLLRNDLANYKLPKKIIYVKNIPKNALGKVQKKLIIQQIENEIICSFEMK